MSGWAGISGGALSRVLNMDCRLSTSARLTSNTRCRYRLSTRKGCEELAHYVAHLLITRAMCCSRRFAARQSPGRWTQPFHRL